MILREDGSWDPPETSLRTYLHMYAYVVYVSYVVCDYTVHVSYTTSSASGRMYIYEDFFATGEMCLLFFTASRRPSSGTIHVRTFVDWYVCVCAIFSSGGLLPVSTSGSAHTDSQRRAFFFMYFVCIFPFFDHENAHHEWKGKAPSNYVFAYTSHQLCVLADASDTYIVHMCSLFTSRERREREGQCAFRFGSNAAAFSATEGKKAQIKSAIVQQ